jgi:ABC-type nitrate/sulfonate/bicarbonate transport system permease component
MTAIDTKPTIDEGHGSAVATAVDVTTGAPISVVLESRAAAVRVAMWGAAKSIFGAVLSLFAILVVWEVALKFFDLSSFVAKSPIDVWKYLVTAGPGPAGSAGDHWALLWPDLRVTLLHSVIGFITGMLAAMIVALIFVLYRPVEQALLPVAVLLRSVPLIAMTPVLSLIFGHGLFAVVIVSGIIVFFPALVTIAYGLRSTSRQAADLCTAYGAGKLTVARKVMIPSALPATFAAARVSVPGALIGALVAEWLVSHNGVGYSMLVAAANTFKYTYLWASVVLVTAGSVIAYYVVAALESAMLARFGPDAGKR